MKQSSREQILQKIKLALEDNLTKTAKIPKENNLKFFPDFKDSLEVTFAKELGKIDGKFVFCINTEDLIQNLKQIIEDEKWETVFCLNKDIQNILLEAEIPFTSSPDDFYQMKAAVTTCEFLIARFGSVMVSSAQSAGRQLNIYPPTHIIIAKTSQLVAEISDAMAKIQEKYKNNIPSMISLISGPSRTADIEKTLILGAHGPKDLYVFLIDDEA